MTEREIYAVLDFVGDVGGLVEFLFVGVGLFAYKFSRKKMEAELTSNLSYIASKEKKEMAEKIMLK